MDDILLIHGPDPDDAVFPRDMWGTTAYGLSGLPDWLESEFRRVPEGLVQVNRCTECGGRLEALIDFRRLSFQEFGRSLGMLKDVIETVHPQAEEFLARHRRCDTDPVEYVLPRRLSGFVDFALRRCKQILRKGDEVHQMLHLLATDGSHHIIPYHDISAPWGSQERAAQVAERHYAVREMSLPS